MGIVNAAKIGIFSAGQHSVADPVRIRCHMPGFTRLAAFFTVRRRPEGRVTA
jgi:hypothetical protein